MKKIICLILISFVISFAITADNTDLPLGRSLYFGLKVGFDGTLTSNGLGNDVFWTGGIIARHNINNIFALQMELNYFGTNSPPGFDPPLYFATSHYIQVPFLIKANLSKGPSPYLDIGPAFDYEFAINTNWPIVQHLYRSFSGIIGLGIDFSPKEENGVELEIKADRSIVNNIAVNYNPAFIYFTLGYIF